MKIIFNDQDHTYKVDGVFLPSVTTILSDMGLYGNITKYFTEYSRDRGRFAHKIIHFHVNKELDEASIDPALMGYYDAWLSFEHDTDFTSDYCEVPLTSTIHHFAGTPDHIGYINGHYSVLDVKTGPIQPVTGLQLSGYEILTKLRLSRFALQLKDDGKYSLKEFKDQTDRNTFLSALALYFWKRNNNIK